MIQIFKNLFGAGAQVDYKQLAQDGATIVDVRTEIEFRSAHIKGSINIPLNVLQNNLSKIKKDKPVITCCASGMRSASAKSILMENGYTEVYNGGGWAGLQHKIKE